MSDASSFSQLAARVEVLERQTQRLKRLFLVCGVAVLSLGTAASTVAAQRTLTFTGSNGTVRISGSGFGLYDAKGHKRLTIGFNSANRPAIYLWDASGVGRLGAYISAADQPVFRLTDEHNVDRAFFGMTTEDKPRIEFDDHASTRRLYVGLTTEDDGLVRTFSTDGKEEIGLGNQFIRIADGTGTERAYLGMAQGNTSIIKLWDAKHIERNFMGEYDDGTSGITAYNAAGTATWSSP